VRATVTVYDPRSMEVLYRDSWHLPNDLPAALPALGTWASAAADLRLPARAGGTAADGHALEWRWVIRPCNCVSCQLPAASEPELPSWLSRGRRLTASPELGTAEPVGADHEPGDLYGPEGG
jgi:hypothetical protein